LQKVLYFPSCFWQFLGSQVFSMVFPRCLRNRDSSIRVCEISQGVA